MRFTLFTHLSRFVRSSRLRTLAGAAFLAMSGAAGVLVASDPIPPAAPVTPPAAPPAATAGAKPVAISDVTLARAVLAAFDADPVLKDVNIIVSIVDRGAVIGGPVASEEIKKRAEAVVRGIAGIESVKNTCFVQADPDPLLRAAIERLKPGTKPTTTTPLPGVAVAPAAPDNFIPPVPPLPPPDLLAGANNPKTSVSQSPSLPGTNILGAPVSPNATPKLPPPPSTAPGALTGSTVVAKPADVQAAVAAIRKNDARYARLAVEVKPDGGLYVTGWSAKAKDAWDFAAELRRVPGVSHVAVDQNLVK
jgi:hypothetical protein